MSTDSAVPLIGCVVRELKKGKDGSGGRADYEHWVFVTTRLSLNGNLPRRHFVEFAGSRCGIMK